MNDEAYMRFALDLAKQGQGQTSPNPVVGAVVVKDGEMVGFGAHLKSGMPHAEVHALQMAGDQTIDATIYVTLEPCSHHGKTAPCADLLINKRIKRAVIACLDPNEKVFGQGVKKLRQAGIKVDIGVLQQEAEALNQIFFHYMKTKTPYVTLKSAISLDGKTATTTGDSKWITGEAAREDVHHYRKQHDAILVGVQTVIVDDPSLTVRLPGGGENPVRIILDTDLRTPADAKVVTDQEAETWIVVGKNVHPKEKKRFLTSDFVQIIQLDQDEVAIPMVLKQLGKKGVTSLFVEGGAEIHGSFLTNGLLNQVITYIAPTLIGGKTAPTSFAGTGFPAISDTVALSIQRIDRIGDDIKIISKPKKEG